MKRETVKMMPSWALALALSMSTTRNARAYAAPEHLRAALEIYRAFPANEKFNAAQQSAISVPLVLAPSKNSPFERLIPSFADALRAHGCANVEIEVIENTYITSRTSSPMLWLNSSNAMPRYNDDYTVLCGGTRRTHVES